MLANKCNESLRSARQAAIPAIDQTEFAPQVHTFHRKKFHFASFDIILRKTLADERNSGVGRDESLDHADAGQLHTDANSRAIRPEQFIKHLACKTCLWENQRLCGHFFQRDLRAMRQRIPSAHHEPQPVFVNMVHAQIWRFRRQRHNSHIDGAIFNPLQNLVAEITINADMDLRKPPLKLRENIRQQIQASRFVRAKQHRPLYDVPAIGHNLHRFVPQSE